MLLQSVVTIRGDSLYCPLPVSIDSYGNCETNCHHCYFRRLNFVWGKELKPANMEKLESTLLNGLRNKNPRSSLSWALSQKKTIRIGNKTDPYQPAEKEHRRTCRILSLLKALDWSAVIQTRHTQLLWDRDKRLVEKGPFILMPIISPGWEKDWELFERKRTTHPDLRLEHASYFQSKGVQVGINGEPFIPGFHTVRDFENTISKLKKAGITSYNTYNLHANDFVYKRLVKLPGVDIERIWLMNQDKNWKPILSELIEVSQQYNIDLGCPDFVNSGRFAQKANTCCGLNVPNPCTFNALTWKKELLEGKEPREILEQTWDGIGDWELGQEIMFHKTKKMYSLKECEELWDR